MRPAVYRVVSLRVHALCFALQYCELLLRPEEKERLGKAGEKKGA